MREHGLALRVDHPVVSHAKARVKLRLQDQVPLQSTLSHLYDKAYLGRADRLQRDRRVIEEEIRIQRVDRREGQVPPTITLAASPRRRNRSAVILDFIR